MLVECPNCQSSMEIPGEDSGDHSSCPVCGSDLPQVVETWTEPTRFPRQFGRYRLLESLGRGHFGAVWKALDTRLQRTVALKMPRFISTGDGMREMFLREGRALARLRHPGIVSVFDVDEHNGVPYIASEFIDGTTLAERLREGPFEFSESARCALLLAEALDYAHQAGIVHRDVKPGNVLVAADGRPMLTDFGLALRHHDDSVAAGKGQILGTPGYMSPEQARGDSHLTDRRSDLYSLGVILFEMTTGCIPFVGEGDSLIERVLNEPPPWPRKLNAGIPKDLESIILKLLEKSPARRYATAAALAEDLHRLQQRQPLRFATVEALTTVAAPVRPDPPPLRRHWRLWMSAAAVIILLLSWLIQFRGPTASTAQQAPVDNASGVGSVLADDGRKEPLHVVIVTDPPGALIVAYPLDEYNSPRVREALRPDERSPVDLTLLPGDYLVVAALDDGRFHEVYRRVPPDKYMLADVLPHKKWNLLTDGRLELFVIRIPVDDVADSMSRFHGAEAFQVGLLRDNSIPQHMRRLPAFLLDVQEVSLGEFKDAWFGQLPLSLQSAAAADPPADDFAVAGVWLDDAIAHAERVGKRLPTEIEYEFAATSGGAQRYPWGNDPTVMIDWTFGPVGQPEFDVATSGDKPVYGLFSNVAEWTSTRFGPYPPQLREVPVFPDPETGDYIGSFVVRGGDSLVLQRKPIGPKWQEFGARVRLGQHLRALQPGLGFRCARSVKARLAADNFERVTSFQDSIER